MFRKKDKLRDSFNQRLITTLMSAKDNWNHRIELSKLTMGYNETVDYGKKIAEAKYMFLFKEAKRRNIKIKR